MDPDTLALDDETENGHEAERTPEADAEYIARLKADMRKAASAREASEARADSLEQRLGEQTRRFALHLAALRAGCHDPDALLGAAAAKGLLDETPTSEMIPRWLQRVRETMPYFFSVSGAGDTTRGGLPLVAARPPRPALNTQQLAARAYHG